MHVHKYLSLLSSLVLLTPVVSAVPVSNPSTAASDPTYGSWHVSGLSIGCSPEGCAYQFVISGKQTYSTPGFNTTCQGSDVANAYQHCTNSAVSANLVPYGYPKWELQVRHQWTARHDDGGVEAPTGSSSSPSSSPELLKQFGYKNFTDGTPEFMVPITSQECAS